MIDLLTGWGNLLLGLTYLFFVGVGPLVDMWRTPKERGNPFGWALILIAFTCGPHHMHYGLHLLSDPGTNGNSSDLVLLAMGIPPALIWEYFRMNAMFRPHKPTDVVLGRTPWWVTLAPSWVGVLTLLSLYWAAKGFSGTIDWFHAWPNVAQGVLYGVAGAAMIDTQVRRAPRWSMSGLGLTGIFVTCAFMHLNFAIHQRPGFVPSTNHMLAIDLLGAVFATYFAYLILSVRARSRSDVLGDIRKPMVLVVDDEPDIRFLFRTTFEHGGVEVVEACDAKEALEVAERQRPALVVLDVAMPGMSGTELLGVLNERYPGVPTVLVSAHAIGEATVDKLSFLEAIPALLERIRK